MSYSAKHFAKALCRGRRDRDEAANRGFRAARVAESVLATVCLTSDAMHNYKILN